MSIHVRRFVRPSPSSVLALVLPLVALVAAGAAHSQTFPSRPMRLIVSFSPGGVSDTVGRQLAQKLQEQMGQPVVVENRPGGSFVIAAEAAARSPADGYTLFMAPDSTMTLNPIQFPNLSYDPVKDFAPVTLVAAQSLFIVASAKAPGKTLKELVAYAKANPGKVSFGASALSAQLIAERLKLKEGIDLLYIPFKGPAPMLQALLNGDIDFAVTTFVPYASYVKDGRLRGLAVTGASRDVPVPEVPTLGELGHGDLAYRFWLGMFVPAATPAPVRSRLNAELTKALNDPEIKQKLAAGGLESMPGTPEELAKKIRDELDQWGQVVRAAKISLGN